MLQRKPDPRALIARLSQESAHLLAREILAPLLPGGRIRTRLHGLVYDFKVASDFAGWGRFRPESDRLATLVAEALPWERAGYLELFPLLRMVLLWPDPVAGHLGVWQALPFNESDAQQRFGINGTEPLSVFLCDPTNGADRFARVLVRVDGRTLWFDGPDLLADPAHADWLRDAAGDQESPLEFRAGLAASERLALLQWRLHQVDQVYAREQRAQARRTKAEQRALLRHKAAADQLETRLRHALAKADATLHSFSQTSGPDGQPGPVIVEWSEHGQRYRYRSTVDANLSVVSSGICLSGRDSDFDLTSLVSVMQ